ncbi:uncharacterized protein LOC122380039 [Amphibalanus amphitrite]|uniref:uncharacterized protein LOC122380039 n=1 Tax=Amphibalanus amphitrite TaxID=1232801 RepID=UPI001C8FFFAC|nr:uncharacterized protein LOC122380039 [Amphibalanus amphitrite]
MATGAAGAIVLGAGAALLLCGAALPPAGAQFIITDGAGATCPTNRLFLSVTDTGSAQRLAALGGIYTGDDTQYRHELGRAVLRSYGATADSNRSWYVSAAGQPSEPAPGPVVAGDAASPRGLLRAPALTGAGWQLWADGGWRSAGAVRLRCVTAAWRCPAGRLHVSGLPFGRGAPAALRGSLVGAAESAFPREPVVDDDPAMTVSVPLEPDSDLLLGTFLRTAAVHMNRPVYRKAGDAQETFLYFDRVEAAGGAAPVPLWLIGPPPDRVRLDSSRLLAVVDSADAPEQVTGRWQYLAHGRQTDALLNVTCEHGRTPAGPSGGADCRFEMPGACGYVATAGRLRQRPAEGHAAGRWYAELTGAEDGRAELRSPPLQVATDSCLSLFYRMRTDSFFSCAFSLEAKGERYRLLTMSSAARDWTRLQRNITAGRYRLRVSAGPLAAADQLHLDSVRVSAGPCGAHHTRSPCHRQPCRHGGTCLPTGADTYTCVCGGGQQGRDCASAPSCGPPPPVEHGAVRLADGALDALPMARYRCAPGYGLPAPLVRSVATCLAGQWRGVPHCRPSSAGSARLGPGRVGGGATLLAALMVLGAAWRQM